MHTKSLNRFQASCIHLFLSLGILAALILIIQFIWYPKELMSFGGWQGVKIVAIIDVILGPFITLLVYNPMKKELKFDLAIIATIQISALSYGSWIVYSERPITQVLANDGLHIISAGTFKHQKISLDKLDNIVDSGTPPYSFYLDLPKENTALNQIRFLTQFTEKIPLSLRADLYRQYPNNDTEQGNISYLSNFSYNAADNCYIVPVLSPQLQGKNACININNGNYSIID